MWRPHLAILRPCLLGEMSILRSHQVVFTLYPPGLTFLPSFYGMQLSGGFYPLSSRTNLFYRAFMECRLPLLTRPKFGPPGFAHALHVSTHSGLTTISSRGITLAPLSSNQFSKLSSLNLTHVPQFQQCDLKHSLSRRQLRIELLCFSNLGCFCQFIVM